MNRYNTITKNSTLIKSNFRKPKVIDNNMIKKKINTSSFCDQVDFSNKNISNIFDIEIPENSIKLFLNNNPLISLNGLNLKKLKFLDISNTLIENLKNFPLFPNLNQINCFNTPFSENKMFKIALLIIFPNIKIINNLIIEKIDIDISKDYPKETYSLILHGWIPTLQIPTENEILNFKNNLFLNLKKNNYKNNFLK